MNRRIVVIGAGAAGLMAAGTARERGHEVFLLEKNERVGKKLLISGKGRCNITNDTDLRGLVENIPGNGKFLYSAFHRFSSADLIRFLNDRGLETKTERGGRVFPVSDSAADVVNALHDFAVKSGSKLMVKTPAAGISLTDGKVTGVRLKNGSSIECDSVILATGGMSYPRTGSTGDGYRMAAELGHTVTRLRPSLVPLVTRETWVREAEGLSLKNISITLRDDAGRKLFTDFGELLFTEDGVSGPVILSASRHAMDRDFTGVRLVIDLKPALTEEVLDIRIRRDFEKFSRKQFRNALDELLPRQLIPIIVDLSGIPGERPVDRISVAERKRLMRLLKGLELNIVGARPIDEAIVTAGGVSTDEIVPSTMESKLIGGLFFAGEVIDVDGYTGGFNLTIAFSTGRLAGNNC